VRIPALKSKDLLSVTDLSREEILRTFQLAARLKADLKNRRPHRLLEGKTLAMIFEKTSTRTRVSFETGMFQLGGHALFLSSDDIQIGRGETIADTARVLSRYVDGIMIRTFSHDTITELAGNAEVPVINGLTDLFHPCQALSDFFTIYEREKGFKGKKLAYVGDGNNMAHSLAGPREYEPQSSVEGTAFQISSQMGSTIEVSSDINLAVQGADYLYTDVWVSMGQEREVARRKKIFARYKITADILKKCADGCAVMHCLPAHRGEEIDGEVLDSKRSIVLDQAENRLHVQKALMCALMR